MQECKLRFGPSVFLSRVAFKLSDFFFSSVPIAIAQMLGRGANQRREPERGLYVQKSSGCEQGVNVTGAGKICL